MRTAWNGLVPKCVCARLVAYFALLIALPSTSKHTPYSVRLLRLTHTLLITLLCTARYLVRQASHRELSLDCMDLQLTCLASVSLTRYYSIAATKARCPSLLCAVNSSWNALSIAYVSHTTCNTAQLCAVTP